MSMPHKFPELHQNTTGKKGDPLHWFTIHQFLSDHYANLFSKLEAYLISESDQYRADIQHIRRRSARQDLSSWAFATLYPNTVRYSIFITLYNQFEHTMIEACTELEKDYPKSIRLSDLKDKGITRVHTYMERVVGIEQPFDPSSRQKLTDLNILRNLIIHNDAIIKKEQTKYIEAIQRINQWAPITIQETKIVLFPNFIEGLRRFLYEQIQYVGKKLQAAGWE
jgi:hypothetical protein